MATADDNVPKAPRGRRLRAGDAVKVVALSALLLLLFAGSAVESAGEQMDRGVERSIVLAVGEPVGWVADSLPFEDAADSALEVIAPDDDLDGQGFDAPTESDASPRGIPPVTGDQFDPAELGVRPKAPRKLKTLLVTGDSLSIPLDSELAKRLAGDAVKVERDPHVGTGISKSGVVDWAKLSTKHVRDLQPEAVVVFIGANEGFPLPKPGGGQIECCGPDWAAVYAGRARRMMNSYRQGGAARVYWLGVPLPRDGRRRKVQRSVNAAFDVAAQPWRSQVRLLDLAA
ncbi:MAG: hypothetical protein M3131_10085, partial [Actinomycetota bacterium]|nr:hypothetical protein [Actinomycetota bacterium]